LHAKKTDKKLWYKLIHDFRRSANEKEKSKEDKNQLEENIRDFFVNYIDTIDNIFNSPNYTYPV